MNPTRKSPTLLNDGTLAQLDLPKAPTLALDSNTELFTKITTDMPQPGSHANKKKIKAKDLSKQSQNKEPKLIEKLDLRSQEMQNYLKEPAATPPSKQKAIIFCLISNSYIYSLLHTYCKKRKT